MRKTGFYKLTLNYGDDKKIVALWNGDGWLICGLDKLYTDEQIGLKYIWPIDLTA